jgi:hypothetical protein
MYLSVIAGVCLLLAIIHVYALIVGNPTFWWDKVVKPLCAAISLVGGFITLWTVVAPIRTKLAQLITGSDSTPPPPGDSSSAAPYDNAQKPPPTSELPMDPPPSTNF